MHNVPSVLVFLQLTLESQKLNSALQRHNAVRASNTRTETKSIKAACVYFYILTKNS